MSTNTAQLKDTVLAEYPYSWSPDATISIEEFLVKYKPSMIQNDGTKPWVWVMRSQDAKTSLIADKAAAILEATAYLQQITDRIEEINVTCGRSQQKTGTRSKKEVREQVQAEAAEKLKEMSKKYGFVCGKWLIFAQHDKVDAVWHKIASSLVSGPLSSTSAQCTKVATSPEGAAPGHQHVICVYIPDVYDREDVTAVMKVLLRQHGLNLSGVKSDLYTTIGLDSKHPSGIPSTIWKNVSLLKDSEIKGLKEAYYTELSTTKDPSKEIKSAMGRSKPLLERKGKEEDPFASDEETDLKGGRLPHMIKKRKI